MAHCEPDIASGELHDINNLICQNAVRKKGKVC